MNVAQAKKVHLKDLLNRLGLEPEREDKGEYWYLSPLRDEADASFKITQDGKAWYDHGAGQGGNILDFTIRYYHLPENDIRGALRKLEGLVLPQASQQDFYTPVKPLEIVSAPLVAVDDKPVSIVLEKLEPLRHRALVSYLNQRGITASIAQPYVQQMQYRHDGKSYFALAFPSDQGGYELRNAYFKGCYQKKDLSTLRAPEESSVVAVFEGFMDFLSAIACVGRTPVHHAIVLNSGSMRHKALEAIRQLGVAQVYLYLDHDPSGRELTAYLQEKLTDYAVSDTSDFYAGYKDVNAFWMEWQLKLGPT